jgi:hypothetical protein
VYVVKLFTGKMRWLKYLSQSVSLCAPSVVESSEEIRTNIDTELLTKRTSRGEKPGQSTTST